MASVLDIDNLLESPLSDLHALAGELDIEGYRLLRKADLTIAILETRGAIGDEIRPKVEAKATELAAQRAERERIAAEREEAEEAAREAAAEERRERAAESRPRGERQRGQRGGRGRGGDGRSGERDGQRSGQRSNERSGQRSGERQPRQRPDRQQRERGGRDRQPQTSEKNQASEKSQTSEKTAAAVEAAPPVAISGVFEPGSGGGGRLRTNLSRRVRGDADVQRGEVRKWRLHRGDVIVGEAKKTKRGRTDFQLVGITSVNGQSAEQRAASKVRFAEGEAAPPGAQFAKRTFKQAPVLAGSRVVITGPTRAVASQMADKLAVELAGSGVSTVLVIAVARPQDATATGYDLVSNEQGKPAEEVLPALELVLERGKRIAETGGDAAVIVDGLDLLPADKASEIFAGSRNLAGHGSLTVIGSAGAGSALEAQATSIAVVSGGRRLKLDKKASWSSH